MYKVEIVKKEMKKEKNFWIFRRDFMIVYFNNVVFYKSLNVIMFILGYCIGVKMYVDELD